MASTRTPTATGASTSTFDLRQYAKELHHAARKPAERRKIFTSGINDVWGADLMDPLGYISSGSSIPGSLRAGFKYILVVEDIYSRFVWAVPLSTKSGPEVMKALQGIIAYIYDVMKSKPRNLWTDEGKEFTNKRLQSWLEAEDINSYHSYGEHKVAHVERVIRTLRGLLQEELTATQSTDWQGVLSMIVDVYNNHPHTSLLTETEDGKRVKTTPRQVYFEGASPIQQLPNHTDTKASIKLGEVVRLSRVKGTFEKDSTANWTAELYRVVKVQETSPVTYLVEDLMGEPIAGAFYRSELQPTKQDSDTALVERIVQRRGRGASQKVLVKWLGWPEKFNSWESPRQLQSLI